MLTRIISEGINILQVKSTVEKVDPDFIVDRAPGEDYSYYITSPGVLLIDVEVYVDEENKAVLDEIEAIGQPVILEKDMGTEGYVKHSCMIQNEISWSKFDGEIYLGAMTLIVQETEGL